MNDTSPHKFRAASNGKTFTRKERVNIIQSQHVANARKAAIAEIVMEEKRKIAAEREEKAKSREIATKVFEFKKENPDVVLKRKKDGTRYFQPRVNGKMGAAVKVA